MLYFWHSIVGLRCQLMFYNTKTSKLEPLSAAGAAVEAVCVSPAGTIISWFQRKAGGPHNDTLALYKVCWMASECTNDWRAHIADRLGHSSAKSDRADRDRRYVRLGRFSRLLQSGRCDSIAPKRANAYRRHNVEHAKCNRERWLAQRRAHAPQRSHRQRRLFAHTLRRSTRICARDCKRAKSAAVPRHSAEGAAGRRRFLVACR